MTDERSVIKLADCDVKEFSPGYFGRDKFLICPITGLGKSFVVKMSLGQDTSISHWQSVNEFVAQNLLKALGFTSIPVAWVDRGKDFSKIDRYYGAVEYLDQLKRISTETDLSAEMRREFIELKLLNVLLDNPDSGGEMFLDDQGSMYSLDYGEALLPERIFEHAVECSRHPSREKTYFYRFSVQDVRDAFIKGVPSLYHLQYNLFSRRFGFDIVDSASASLLQRWSSIDVEIMKECFQSLEKHTHRIVSDQYQEQIRCIQLMAKDLR